MEDIDLYNQETEAPKIIHPKEEYVKKQKEKSAKQRHDKKGKDMKKFNP